MSLINVTNVSVLSNPAPFNSEFEFEVTFECYPPGITEELEWKLIYVGSADDSSYDQELDSLLVGPISIGRNQFIFTSPPPDASRIPQADIMEVTVLLLTGLYMGKEFIRIGYYVNNEYPTNEIELREEWDRRRLIVEEREKHLALTKIQSLEQEQLLQSVTHLNNQSTTSTSSLSSSSPLPSPSAVSGASIAIPSIPPLPPLPQIKIDKLYRNILADKPRVTRFAIPWEISTSNSSSLNKGNNINSIDEYQMSATDEATAREEEQRLLKNQNGKENKSTPEPNNSNIHPNDENNRMEHSQKALDNDGDQDENYNENNNDDEDDEEEEEEEDDDDDERMDDGGDVELEDEEEYEEEVDEVDDELVEDENQQVSKTVDSFVQKSQTQAKRQHNLL